jgi:internalin A
LRTHLRDLDSGTEEIRESKLVVVGNGRVGKTQICRRLRGLAYDESIPSTHGITVTAEPWAGSTDGESLNIWDFGGQDIYHGAHTLFMKTSAVFLVAWHPDFESSTEESLDGIVFRNNPLAYWLEYVKTLGRKHCPVVVVQTMCDRPEQEIRQLPAGGDVTEFPSLKPCWYSARTNRGRGALDDALRDAVSLLRERDGITTIGSGRMRVLRQLRAWRDEDSREEPGNRRHRTLSQDEFRELCEREGGVSSPEWLLDYLHNLGIVFFRPELFRDHIILDQTWALDAVYSVFDRRKALPLILGGGGRFTRSLLDMTAWRGYSAPEQHLFLSLMETCGMAFISRRGDERLGIETEYVAPDLLPERQAVAAQLDGRWSDEERDHRLEYGYTFLHPGLMRALICRVGQRSHETGVYWRDGVWVYERTSGCRALLEKRMRDDRKGNISLRIQGSRHEYLAQWFREQIESCNRLFGYPDLAPEVDEFSRAPGHEEARATPPRRPAAERDAGAHADVRLPHEREQPATPPELVFEKLPATSFPPREPEVFVSYARGNETAEGRQRGQVVDDLCASLRKAGINVRRDRDDMRPGDLISEFMDRLAEGDYIVAVISDKYLKSEYCMYELFRIYRNCADKPERFLQRVIPLVLEDAGLDSMEGRFMRAVHWDTQERQLTPLIKDHVGAVGTEFFRKFKLIGEFARNTSSMLEYLVDKLEPRDVDRMAADGFNAIIRQIRGQ